MTDPPIRVPFVDLVGAHRAIADELSEAARRVIDSGNLILGTEVEAFEREWAAYCGAPYCVGVGNGFDALTLALRAVGVSAGDEVLVPTNTYVATWLAVSAVGALPVGVEPRPDTMTLDPDRLDAAWTARTSAVLPVHLYGRAADMRAILGWARRRGVPVVVDAAQAHGARCGDIGVGNLGDAVAWSFYPTKNLGALGDGGAVTCADASIDDRVRLLRNYGSPRRDVTTAFGVNSRLDEVQAALLRVKLAGLDAANARRRALADRYRAALADLDTALPGRSELVLPPADHGAVWHQFVVRVRDRDRVRAALRAAGVQTLVHYPTPPFAQPAYARRPAGRAAGAHPIATMLAGEVMSLPVTPQLTDAQQELVIAELRRCLA